MGGWTMTIPISLRRWVSVNCPPTFALEVTAGPLDPNALPEFLASLSKEDLGDAVFVVLRLAALELKRSGPALSAANTWSRNARLCLAVDRGTLGRIEFNTLDADRIGLILDDVDAETPLSAMVRDSIEAIRFRADFIAQARGSVRIGCVLTTMLDLATNLGLGTLGPATGANDTTSHLLVPSFDFVPASGIGIAADQAERRESGVPPCANDPSHPPKRSTAVAIASTK
jgi:hypothetical protein